MVSAAITPLTVTAPGGKTNLIVMDQNEPIPAPFALMGARVPNPVVLRISGGCKEMTAQDKQHMIQYFVEAFAGFRGLVWTGATRQLTNEGELDPMVTDVVGAIAEENPECVALGTAPRTDMLSLQGESQLVLDGYGTRPNPTMSGILIVQNGACGKLDWDGDLPAYFQLMEYWRDYSQFTALGGVFWNGGAITLDEIAGTANRGWPAILVKGSGRITDEIVSALEEGHIKARTEFTKTNSLRVASKDDPMTLRKLLIEQGFLA